MPKTDAQKRANNKYDLAHYRVLGCKLLNEEAEAFKEECKRRGTTPNAVFKEAIIKFMSYKEDPEPEDLVKEVTPETKYY